MTTPQRYFDLWDDLYVPGRWHLRAPNVDENGQVLDPWRFKDGEVLQMQAAPVVRLFQPGVELEFNLTGMTVPLVNRRVVSLFERLGLSSEIQFIPARVEGATQPYFILNALRVIRCIDDARCMEALHWLPEDNRPDEVGHYRGIIGLKIDTSKVGDAQLFRTWGWKMALIVSERVKQALEGEGITGTQFTEV